MNPFKVVGPYLQDFVLGKDADWKTQMSAAIRDMALSAVTIPDKTNRFLERANRGEVRFEIAHLPEGALLLYSAAQQIVFAFLAVAAGALAYVLADRGEQLLAAVAWSGSALCVLGLLAAMLRARGLRKAMRQ
jgi:hypothetical protein